MKTYLKAFRLKRFWLLLLLPAAFLLDFAARQSADFAEWYAVTIYPVYAQFFSAITGVVPFSVGEWDKGKRKWREREGGGGSDKNEKQTITF